MCVFFEPASVTLTVGYMGDATHPKHGYVHVLGYQNQVRNLAKGPNAMILHLPAAEAMGPDNLIDMTGAESLMDDMYRAWHDAPRLASAGSEPEDHHPEAVLFEHDIYTVVVGRAEAIAELLPQVPEARRPALHPELFAWYAANFPRWQIVLCCFAGEDEQGAKPLFMWYRPTHPDRLFFPALDAHTGMAPGVEDEVEINHVLLASSVTLEERWWHFDESKKLLFDNSKLPETVRPFFHPRVAGASYLSAGVEDYRLGNGDFAILLSDINQFGVAGGPTKRAKPGEFGRIEELPRILQPWEHQWNQSQARRYSGVYRPD